MPPTLSVIVPATDAPPTLNRCLAAIDGSRGPAPEVIVVREPAGAGPAAARNRGAERSSGEVLVFLDSDVEVHPDAFELIRAAFTADPDLTALFGAYDDDPEPHDPVSRFRNLLHHHVHVTSAGPAETFWAGLGAIRASAFRAMGGFDAERYPHPAVEDVELGTRLKAARERIRLEPRLQGRHLRRWSVTGMVHTDLARRGMPWVELQLERRSISGALNLSWGHRISALGSLALVGAIATRRVRTALAACLGVVALNARFYALLVRRGGPRLLAIGVPLHILHQLAAAAAVPAAALRFAVRGPSRGPG
jgi:hypothetical protein